MGSFPERYKDPGNLSFGSVKGPKKANRWILWLYKVEKKLYFYDWFLLKTWIVHLQHLKGMQSSQQGMWKGYHLLIEGIRKGYLFREKWYIKGGKGLDLGAEPPCINISSVSAPTRQTKNWPGGNGSSQLKPPGSVLGGAFISKKSPLKEKINWRGRISDLQASFKKSFIAKLAG